MASSEEIALGPWTLKQAMDPERDDTSTNTTPSLIQKILKDIKDNRTHRRKKRGETLFYKIVQGGNVQVIKQVMQRLKQPKYAGEYAWILGKTDLLHARASLGQHKTKVCYKMGQFLTFLALAILYTLLTPVFYVCHAAMAYVWNILFPGLCEISSHPLSLVCRSKSAVMIKLFHDEGLDIYLVDSNCNNIMHHLAYVSSSDPTGAKEMWDLLLQEYKEADMLSVCSLTNSMGLNALEYAAKFGSLEFVCHMLDSQKLTRTVDLWVDANTVFVNDVDVKMSVQKAPMESPHNGLVQANYDVSRYENSDLQSQSLLHRILAQRETCGRKCNNVELLLETSPLSIWIRKKINMYYAVRWFSSLYGILITVVLLFYMSLAGGDNNLTPLSQPNIVLTVSIFEEAAKIMLNETDIMHYTLNDMWTFCWNDTLYFGQKQTYSWCQQKAFETLTERCGGQLDSTAVLQDTGWIMNTEKENLRNMLTNTFAALISLYLFYDLVMRLVYLWNNIHSSPSEILKGISREFTIKKPGSYTAKQLSVLAFSLICISLGITTRLLNHILPFIFYPNGEWSIATNMSYYDLMYENITVISVLLTLSMIFRMISFAFTLRLIPKLGHFLILTFKMTATLLSFLVVYFVILVGFGALFHFLLRDPQCPSLRLENFQTITESCFQTFLMMLGLAEFPENHSSLARGAYVFYLLISAVVLLNLIIAIMSSLVEEINEQPNKAATHLMEHLEDALAAEAWLHIVTGPWSGRLHRWMLQRSGFEVNTGKVDRAYPGCCRMGDNCSIKITILQET